MSNRYLVGTSGWHYGHWQDRFYPQGLPKRQWLAYYAQRFPTVEVNNTFYRLPQPSAFDAWRKEAPPGFIFALKASRGITHYRKLVGVEGLLAALFERARRLRPALGPILYQLPPHLQREDERLSQFLDLLPADLQHAVEFRHPSWFADPIYDLLRRRGVALCLISMPDFDCPLVATAPFIYMRFHGTTGKYQGSYPDEELQRWAVTLEALADPDRRAYIYFNNDQNAYAVYNALTLASLLSDAQRSLRS